MSNSNTQKQREGKEPPAKERGRGIVKSVLSGDTIVVQEVAEKQASNPPNEREITLSSLNAPRLGRRKTQKKDATLDEAFAWDSREFLRKKCIGKRVTYVIDNVNATTGRTYATINLFEKSECLNHAMVSNGWATVFKAQAGKEPKRHEYATLLQLEEEAMNAGRGLHNKDEGVIQAAVRPVITFDSFQLYNQLKGKTLNGIVEQARNGSTLRVTLVPSFHSIAVLLSGVQTPGFRTGDDGTEQAEPFAREAKAFVDQHVLQRDMLLTLDGVDKQGNFFGSIKVDGHDVAEELLKNGLGTFVQWSAAARGQADLLRLRQAEKLAKEQRRRLFARYVESKAVEASSNGSTPKEFSGKVTDIATNGNLTIVTEGPHPLEYKITMSSLRFPRGPYPGDDKDDEKLSRKERDEANFERSHAIQAKEFMRCRLIGHTVRAVLDYVRPAVKRENGESFPEKPMYSVFAGDLNIGVALVEQGLAWVVQHRGGEDRSQHYEQLVLAENKAKSKNLCLHGPVDSAPTLRVNDLSVDSTEAKAKQFLPYLKRTPVQKAVVEFVLSSTRIKVFVPKESLQFILVLSGVRSLKRGESSETDEFSNQALIYARERLHLRDVEVEVESVDKGSFTGQLYIDKKNFALQLLEVGFGSIHRPSVERLSQRNEFIKAQEAAQAARRNIWRNYDAEAEKKRREAEKAAVDLEETGGINTREEYLDVIITDVRSGATFFIQIASNEAAGLDDMMAKLSLISKEEDEGKTRPEGFAPKAGDIIRAQFTQDDSWYRAKVISVGPSKQYRVQYIDYGNGEELTSQRIRPLPAGFHSLPAQAQEACLAYVKAPSLESDFGSDSLEFLKELVLGKRMMANIEYRDGGRLYLSLGDPDSNVHVNAAMIRAGLARLDRRHRRYSSALFVKLRDEEESAKSSRAGLWLYGDAPDSDEEEEHLRRGAATKAKPAGAKDQPTQNSKSKTQTQPPPKKK